jgi:hypothetical protein
MAERTAEWHVVGTDGQKVEFDSVTDLLAALARAPTDFQPGDAASLEPGVADSLASARAAAPRSVGVGAGNNQLIVFGPGCTPIVPGTVIVAVEVTGLVILSRAECNAFAPPFLPLWPSAPGTPTRRAVPVDWQQTARSALAWG